MPPLLAFNLRGLLGLGFLEVLPDQQAGHHEKEKAGADPHRLTRQ